VHPEDVRELVAEQVADLERMLDERPELGVRHVELEDTDLFVTVAASHAASTEVPPELAVEIAGQKKLIIPGAAGQQSVHLLDIPREVPLLGQTSARELLLRLGCDGFNGRPPLAELLRPEGRTPLPDAEWPRDPSNQGIVAAHPKYKRKFFCRPGFREFHEHDQHADRPWDAIREQTTIGWLVVTLLGDLQTRWRLL
jgi:hypothetical protein